MEVAPTAPEGFFSFYLGGHVCVCVRLRASYLVAVHHEVVGGNERFEDHHPAGVGCALKQRVRQLGNVHVHLIGAVDQIWRAQKHNTETVTHQRNTKKQPPRTGANSFFTLGYTNRSQTHELQAERTGRAACRADSQRLSLPSHPVLFCSPEMSQQKFRCHSFRETEPSGARLSSCRTGSLRHQKQALDETLLCHDTDECKSFTA